jgi:hypothetical protein
MFWRAGALSATLAILIAIATRLYVDRESPLHDTVGKGYRATYFPWSFARA